MPIVKKYYLRLAIITLSVAFVTTTKAQNVGINTTGALPSINSILDLNTGNANNLGLIIPNVSLSALGTFNPPIANASTAGDVGMMVYNTNGAVGSGVGYYYWSGAAWVSVGGGAATNWKLTGNTGIVHSTSAIGVLANNNFIGSTNAADFIMAANGYERIRIANGTGNVGVSNTAPTTMLQIGNAATTTGKLSVFSQDFQYGQIQVGNPVANGEASMQFISNVSAFGSAASSSAGSNYMWNIGAGTYGLGGAKFVVSNVGTGPIMTFVSPTGLVGIGTTAPQQNLSVFNGMVIDQNGQNNGLINNALVTGNGLTFGSASGEGIASKRTGGGNQFGLDFYTNFSTKMSLTWGGFFGIGTTAPARMLELSGVANTARIDGLASTGTVFNQPVANKADLVYANDANGDLWSLPAPSAASVLTSSAAGVLSWQNGTVPTGAGTLNYLARWTPSGTQLGIGIAQDNGTETAIQTAAYGFPAGAPLLVVTGNASDVTAILGTTAQATGYGIQGTQTAGSGTTAGVNGTSNSATGYGVQGSDNVGNGVGVQGSNSVATGTSVGVEGFIGALTAPSNPAGVYGVTQNTSTFGVLGRNTAVGLTLGVGGFGSNYVPALPGNGAGGAFASNNVGAWGTYNGVGFYGMGVQGVGYLGSSGVYSENWGVQGNIGATGHVGDAGIFGYYGGLLGIPNTPSGITGVSNVASANGVYGYNVTGNAGSTGSGVVGATVQTAGFGVLGINYTFPGNGVFGIGGGGAGSYFALGEGVMGNGQNFGVIGYTNTNPYAGVWGATNTYASYYTNSEGVMGSGAYGVMGLGTAYGGYFANTSGWYTYVAGGGWKVLGNGSVSTEVMDEKNQPRVLTCPEAPEVLFEDFGSATLVNGKVHVDMDKLFANNVTISEKHPLRVIITLNDQCNGVYVTNRTATGFDVVELNGGTSNASFTYEVVANRAALYNDKHELMENFADERFMVGPGKITPVTATPSENKTPDTSVTPVSGASQNLKKGGTK